MYSLIKVLVVAKLISRVHLVRVFNPQPPQVGSVGSDHLSPDYGPVPDKCHPIPSLMYRQCCIFPPFFAREVARECGAIFKINFINKNYKVAGLQRKAITGCDHWECILKKYFLLNQEGNADDEKYFMHLDRWVDLNPKFSTVMLNAKIHCKQDFRMFMPLNPCEFYDFQACIRNNIEVNCPEVLQTPECDEQKSFYQECKEYFQ